MAAGTFLMLYVLSVRKRHYEILENLSELSSVMQAHVRTRPQPEPQSNDPSPISVNAILNTPRSQPLISDEITEINTDYTIKVEDILLLMDLALIISLLTAVYCSSYPCRDIFGPEL
jgi:hypothetical protein